MATITLQLCNRSRGKGRARLQPSRLGKARFLAPSLLSLHHNLPQLLNRRDFAARDGEHVSSAFKHDDFLASVERYGEMLEETHAAEDIGHVFNG